MSTSVNVWGVVAAKDGVALAHLEKEVRGDRTSVVADGLGAWGQGSGGVEVRSPPEKGGRVYVRKGVFVSEQGMHVENRPDFLSAVVVRPVTAWSRGGARLLFAWGCLGRGRLPPRRASSCTCCCARRETLVTGLFSRHSPLNITSP